MTSARSQVRSEAAHTRPVLATPNRGHVRRVMRYLAGAVVGGVAVYACFAKVGWQELAPAFRTARASWVVAGVVSALLTVSLVTIRWAVLLGDGVTARTWRVSWNAVLVGQTVNIVFPLRFGEGARMAITCRGLGLPVGSVMVSLALERVFDAAAYATMMLPMAAAGLMPDAYGGIGPAAVTLTLATIVAVFCFGRLGPLALAAVRRRFDTGSRLARWLAAYEMSIRDGWADVTRWHRVLPIGLLSALTLLSSASTNIFIFRAFQLPVPAVAALVLLVVLQVGLSIAVVPGNLGIFHYLTVMTLALWHVPRSTALATAIVLHAVTFGPRVLLGALALPSAHLRRTNDHLTVGTKS